MALDIQAIFDENEDEYLHHDRVDPGRRLHARPDLHVFLALDRLVPGDRDMVADAQHDEIFLQVMPDEVAGVATEQDVVDMIRCGLRYDSDNDSFCMFT